MAITMSPSIRSIEREITWLKRRVRNLVGAVNSIQDETSGGNQRFEQLGHWVRNRRSEQIEIVVILSPGPNKLWNFGCGISRRNRCQDSYRNRPNNANSETSNSGAHLDRLFTNHGEQVWHEGVGVSGGKRWRVVHGVFGKVMERWVISVTARANQYRRTGFKLVEGIDHRCIVCTVGEPNRQDDCEIDQRNSAGGC